MTTEILQFKRGDTINLTMTDSIGDLTGISIEAAIMVGPKKTIPLTVTETDMPNGEYAIAATAAETATWPLGHLPCDIKYSSGDVVSRSFTFEIYISQEVTP